MTPFAVLEAPDFSWNLVCDPIAVHHGGTTYLSGIRDDGYVRVAAFDHATRTADTVSVFSGLVSPSGNIHNSAAICRRTDGRLVLAACQEGAPSVAVRISTDPDDVTAWGSVITAGSGSYTYVSLYQLADAPGAPLYLFTRQTSPWRLGYFKSTDGGATWGSFVSLLATPTGGPMYWRIGSDQSTKLHLFVTDTDRSDATPSSIYHFMLESDTLKDSTGAVLTGGQVTDGTLVQDTTYNAARPEGWAILPNGRPCLLAKCSETDRDPTVLRVCVWTGCEWDAVTAVAIAAPTSYAGMDKADPYSIYLGRSVAGHYEMTAYRSDDYGATWEATDWDHGSGMENGGPDTPLNAAAELRVIWQRGSGVTDSDFYYGVMGAGEVPAPPSEPPGDPAPLTGFGTHVIAEGGSVPPTDILTEDGQEYVYSEPGQ